MDNSPYNYLNQLSPNFATGLPQGVNSHALAGGVGVSTQAAVFGNQAYATFAPIPALGAAIRQGVFVRGWRPST